MADGNSPQSPPARPQGLVEGSGRLGEPRALGSSLDPDLAADNFRRIAERLSTVRMTWRVQLTAEEQAAMVASVAALRRLIDLIDATRPR